MYEDDLMKRIRELEYDLKASHQTIKEQNEKIYDLRTDAKKLGWMIRGLMSIGDRLSVRFVVDWKMLDKPEKAMDYLHAVMDNLSHLVVDKFMKESFVSFDMFSNLYEAESHIHRLESLNPNGAYRPWHDRMISQTKVQPIPGTVEQIGNITDTMQHIEEIDCPSCHGKIRRRKQ